MNFNGFDDWIEIFRGGPQTDSKGREHDGDDIIRKAVASFDPSVHEPPLVIGHPKENGPAFAWVKGVKESVNNGAKTLLAKFRQVVPQVEEAVKQGLYKKRSASFYPDGRLRHVGLLGAAPPAVKGLADLKFDEEEESLTFNGDFVGTAGDADTLSGDADGAKKKEGKMEIKDFMELLKFWKEAGPEAGGQRMADGDKGMQFTEADVEAAKKVAAEEAAKTEREKVESEFAEETRQAQRAQRDEAISDWYDQNLKEGKVLPAWGKMGLKEFMLQLDGEEVIQFAEETKTSRLEWFKAFMGELQKVVNFEEIAKRGDDTGARDADEKLIQMARKRAKDDKVSFGDAMVAVSKENPELYKEYTQGA